jgi:prepilin-type processing-associated H-X9-DG protein
MSYHPGGLDYLFGDGSVKFLKLTINLGVYRALGSRAGGEVVGADQY